MEREKRYNHWLNRVNIVLFAWLLIMNVLIILLSSSIRNFQAEWYIRSENAIKGRNTITQILISHDSAETKIREALLKGQIENNLVLHSILKRMDDLTNQVGEFKKPAKLKIPKDSLP